MHNSSSQSQESVKLAELQKEIERCERVIYHLRQLIRPTNMQIILRSFDQSEKVTPYSHRENLIVSVEEKEKFKNAMNEYFSKAGTDFLLADTNEIHLILSNMGYDYEPKEIRKILRIGFGLDPNLQRYDSALDGVNGVGRAYRILKSSLNL